MGSVLGSERGGRVRRRRGAQPEGLLISDFVTRGGSCDVAIDLSRRTGVTITDSDLEGGGQFGIRLTETNDVVIQRTAIRSTLQPGDGDIGVFFERFKDNPAFHPFDDMSDVYVLPSTTIEGFDAAIAFEAPLDHDDGDDIAYCAEETSPLPGCVEAP